MTCADSRQLDWLDGWISSSVEAHVKTCPLPDVAQASPVNAADSGGNSSALPGNVKRRSSGGRTSGARFPATAAETLGASSIRWPTQGMMRGGRLTALPTSARPTGGNVSGCWPTARSTDGAKGGPGQVNGRGKVDSLPGAVNGWPTPAAGNYRSGIPNRADRPGYQNDLPDVVAKVALMWPTPDAAVMNDGETLATFDARRDRLKATHLNGNGAGTPLAVEIQRWPTPTVRDWKDGSPVDGVPVNALLGRAVWTAGGGRLNPAWVEHLMGWPTGWTGLPPEVIGRMAKAQRRLRGKRRARLSMRTAQVRRTNVTGASPG